MFLILVPYAYLNKLGISWNMVGMDVIQGDLVIYIFTYVEVLIHQSTIIFLSIMLKKKLKIGNLGDDRRICFKRILQTLNFCSFCEIKGCVLDCRLTNTGQYSPYKNSSLYMYVPKYVTQEIS